MGPTRWGSASAALHTQHAATALLAHSGRLVADMRELNLCNVFQGV